MKAIFTNDDAGAANSPQSVEWFQTVVDWLNGQGIKGTFFWVPKRDEDRKCLALWKPAMMRARDQGHDFQLHGLRHDSCLEFGLPQESTGQANPKPFQTYESDLPRWQAEHSVESLERKLEQGVAIHQEVFGERPVIFRAPCFGVCAAMYEALTAVGIRYSSS